MKFTVDCLKFLFSKNHQVLDLDIDFKTEFIQNNPPKKDDLCCLCDFPIDPRAENGWADHVFRAEHLFLENIYSEKQMRQMGIDKFEYFAQKLNKILDNLESFCASVEFEHRSSIDPDIEEIVEKIKRIKTSKEDDGKVTKEKAIAYLYEHSIGFIPRDKVKGEFPISNKFLSNMIAIVKNRRDIRHSHVSRKIIGYEHDFCNWKCRENYYTIPVFAHNQFRFDFFLFLKGLRPSVWETTDIAIGGKNPTDVNFAIIKNQVRFIDTVKYFQQSLASLADSMTDTERENIRKICRKFLAEKLLFLNDQDKKCVLDYLASSKGTIPYQMITDFDSLYIPPEKDFFKYEKFYSSLKEKSISMEEYENVKIFLPF